MYIADNHQSSRPQPPPPPAVDFYSKNPHHSVSVPASIEQEVDENSRDMMIEVVSTSDLPLSSHHHNSQHSQMVIGNPGSTGEEPELNNCQLSGCGGNRPISASTAPKKRAETWVQEETRSLIGLRREIDSLFNTSKSNKHLWEQISAKMKEKGFDRSPTMCTDKWRNLLKEFKKVKQQEGVNGSAKMSYYKEIEEILRERNRTCATPNSSAGVYKSPNRNSATAPAGSAKVDAFLQFSEKVIEDAGIPFGPMEAANDRQALNLDRRLDHEAHALSITEADTVGEGGVPPSFWREGPGNGQENHSYAGRVISVKWGDYSRRIGIDGTAEAISHAIKSAFRIRTKRAFWLEDEDQIVRSLDRDMPLGNYHLHLDEGVTIKVCHYNESDHMAVPHTEEKTFYSEEDLREFLNRRGWSSLRELQGYRNVDNLDDLRSDALYRGAS